MSETTDKLAEEIVRRIAPGTSMNHADAVWTRGLIKAELAVVDELVEALQDQRERYPDFLTSRIVKALAKFDAIGETK